MESVAEEARVEFLVEETIESGVENPLEAVEADEFDSELYRQALEAVKSRSEHLYKKEPGVWVVDGTECRRKTRVKAYLMLGIDTRSGDEQLGGGQNDTLILLVIDQNADTYARIPINRNTYAEFDSLDEKGKSDGSVFRQIDLAHSQGDGGEMSCENAARAVSKLFYGIPIDGYIALNMDSIGVINNMVGGVEVLIEDDFNDPALVKGQRVLLTDEQAETFVRGRMGVGDGTNENRMRRQEAYLAGLKVKVEEKMNEAETFANHLYDVLLPHMTTTFTGNDLSKMIKAILKNEDLGVFEVRGEAETDRYGYAAFYADEESILDIVRTFWYEPIA